METTVMKSGAWDARLSPFKSSWKGKQEENGVEMMETTPNWRRDQESPKSSLLFVAQARHYEKRVKSKTVSPLATAPVHSFSMMPSYNSSGNANSSGAVVNPFENPSVLPHRLKGPTCSPNFFANIKSPSQFTDFHWTIEDISKINPAKIDSPLCQIDEAVDEDTESQAQEAIQLYFSTHDIQSPAEGPKPWVSPGSASTPDGGHVGEGSHCLPPERIHSLLKLHHKRAESTPCGKLAERRLHRPMDTGTQTTLSFPPVLPEEIAAILEPYMKTKDESVISDEINTSSNTLRRKLFFHNDNEFLSPVNGEDDIASKRLRYATLPAGDDGNTCNYLDDDLNLKDRPELRQGWTPTDKRRMETSASGEFPSTPDISPIKMAGSPQFGDDVPTSASRTDGNRLEEHPAVGVDNSTDFTRNMELDSSNRAMMSYIADSSVSGSSESLNSLPPRLIFSSTVVGRSGHCVESFDDTAVFTSTRVRESTTHDGGAKTSTSLWSDTGYQTIGGGSLSMSRSVEEQQTTPVSKIKSLRKKRQGILLEKRFAAPCWNKWDNV